MLQAADIFPKMNSDLLLCFPYDTSIEGGS